MEEVQSFLCQAKTHRSQFYGGGGGGVGRKKTLNVIGKAPLMYSFPNLDQSVEFHGEVLYLEESVNKFPFPLEQLLDGCLLGLCIVKYRGLTGLPQIAEFPKGEVEN